MPHVAGHEQQDLYTPTEMLDIEQRLIEGDDTVTDEEMQKFSRTKQAIENQPQVLGTPTQDYRETTGTPFDITSPYRHLQNINQQEFEALQDRLVGLGVLDPDADWVPGKLTLNDPTVNALGDVMTYANNTGQGLNGAIRNLEVQIASGDLSPEDLGGGDGGATERGRYYQLPDYSTLKARVRGEFKQSLGRDPTAEEMQMFTDDMMGDYQSQIARQQDMFADVEAGRDTTVQEIDPVARFQEAFQQKMGGQIKSIEEQQDTAVASRASERQVDVAEREALR